MQNSADLIIFSVVLSLLLLAIGIAVYVVLTRTKANAVEAASLTTEQARSYYAPNMPTTPLLYSVLIGNEHIIKDETDAQIARITITIAKSAFRVITIGNQSYECFLERSLLGDKGHLFHSGCSPENDTPLLTFEPKIKTEYYSNNSINRYYRNIYDRRPGIGWTIYNNHDQPVAYIESLYGSLKASAFLFHPIQDMPLIEQLFIIAMSDKTGGRMYVDS